MRTEGVAVILGEHGGCTREDDPEMIGEMIGGMIGETIGEVIGEMIPKAVPKVGGDQFLMVPGICEVENASQARRWSRRC
jgi:hypothetical protein